MNPKSRAPRGASYPVTISTPFGVLRLAYVLDEETCPGCGKLHGHAVMLDASPRLKGGDADDFLWMLPELLAGVGDLAYLYCVTSRPGAAVGA